VSTVGTKGYAHRQNADGTFDSICLSCYETITSVQSEPELIEDERVHSCRSDTTFVDGMLRILEKKQPYWRKLDEQKIGPAEPGQLGNE
jgi:hypothetical protein